MPTMRIDARGLSVIPLGMERGSPVVTLWFLSNHESRTTPSLPVDEAVATPTSSECGENTTVRDETVVVGNSFDASPSIKKEVKKEA